MSWGDSWGSTPRSNALELAEAFFAGRERRRGKSEVVYENGHMEYRYKGRTIAKLTPDGAKPRIVADKLLGKTHFYTYPELTIKPHYHDKGEARHFQALGVKAQWQYGGDPMLLEGVSAREVRWFVTLAELSKFAAWVKPPPAPKKVWYPQRERFVNITLPLFA